MKHINQTIVDALRNDKKLRIIHLQEAMNLLFTKDSRVALLMFRDIINASIGFQSLAIKVGKSDKTLMGMLTGKSNPTIESISRIISAIIAHENITTETRVKKMA